MMGNDFEINMYIQKIIGFFNKNKDYREEFYDDESKEQFLIKIKEFATANFKEKGDPKLTVIQFESLKKRKKEENFFIDYHILGRVYLN